MSDTDILRKNEKALLPPGYLIDVVFDLAPKGYQGTAEVDGFHPVSKDAIEICFSESGDASPKPGQRRKLATDILKLIFLKELGLISRGRVFVTSIELYTWCQQTPSWLNAARAKYGITVELKILPKASRKQVRHALAKARREKN
jgi:hypothetical protein